ncbi:TetR/AcrR family transcriptional regulator [Aeromicrobium sp. CF4.19]|uniref:TetR/AcrR family transcriptional regulator n=1 Tax=Aeromicrobium sp. CF4.19 TaxID=3373082 RepID=UPI003EE6ECE1
MAMRDRTATKLLDAAEEVLFVDGIVATPVDAILARAGVSTATLYRGFRTKEALVAAVLERRHRAWMATWDKAVASAADDEGRLLAVFDALELTWSRPGGARWCAFLGAAAEYAEPPPELAEAVRTDTAALRSRLGELATPVAGDGAAELAEQLLLVVSGTLAMRLREPVPSVGPAKELAAVLVRRASTRPG